MGDKASNFDILKDPEVAGSEIDYKVNMYKHLDRIGKLACAINPYDKFELFQFESSINALKAFIAPYLDKDFYSENRKIELKKRSLDINRIKDHRSHYYNILLLKLATLTRVMDKRGMLLKTYENEDIDVSNFENQ